MDQGVFPEVLKTGKITPIYKKDDLQKFGNYRPVSVLSIFSKIFEKIIYSRLYSFLTTMNVIYDNQFGFRNNHSTSNAINYSINTGRNREKTPRYWNFHRFKQSFRHDRP